MLVDCTSSLPPSFLRYADLEERYRTRVLYAQADEVEQCRSELADASTVRVAWQELVDEADRVDYRWVRGGRVSEGLRFSSQTLQPWV